MKQQIIIISAMTRDRVIGTGSSLPWHIPSEYQQFLDHITEQTVIMGRKSYEIFKKDMLPKRMIVVSRSLEKLDDGLLCRNLESAVELAKSFSEDIFICGGAEIYCQSISLADSMYLSYIHKEYEGTTYFPEFDGSLWNISDRQNHDEYEYVVYTRKN